MPAYDPADLPQPTPQAGTDAPLALRVALPPGGTLAHLAAVYAEGASAFIRLAVANGVVDPIPYPGPPPRGVRNISLSAGAEIILPSGDL